MHVHGYTRPIGEMAAEWQRAELTCFDLKASVPTTTCVDRWFSQKPRARVLRLLMESGDEIKATAESQFPYDRLEIICNGVMIADATPGGPRHSAAIRLEYPAGKSCWLAARAYEKALTQKVGIELPDLTG